MLYKIVHEETLVGEYFIDAESTEDCREKWREEIEEGRIDFSNLEQVSAVNTIWPMPAEDLE